MGLLMNVPEVLRPEKRDWLPMVVFAVGLLAQAGGTIWWFSSLNSRVGVAESDIAEAKIERTSLAGQIDLLRTAQAQGSAFMGRIDERMTAQGASLARIERLLEDRG